MIKKFRKKPIVIEAIKFVGSWSNYNDIQAFMNTDSLVTNMNGTKLPDELIIETLEGEHIASKGDWIIKGIKGEFYPCKPDIFDLTYESAE